MCVYIYTHINTYLRFVLNCDFQILDFTPQITRFVFLNKQINRKGSGCVWVCTDDCGNCACGGHTCRGVLRKWQCEVCGFLRHYKVKSIVLCVYGVRVDLCASSRGCFHCCKAFVSETFQRRRPFTQLNESDFGFQTVSSSCTTPPTGGGAGETLTSINNTLASAKIIRKMAAAAGGADKSINKWLRSPWISFPGYFHSLQWPHYLHSTLLFNSDDRDHMDLCAGMKSGLCVWCIPYVHKK